MTWCKYSDMFGKPKEGVHRYRFMNIAIVDVVFTIIGAYIIYLLINSIFNINVSYFAYLFAFFILSILLHKLFCVDTTIKVLLFGKN